jgi:hypothetical protein
VRGDDVTRLTDSALPLLKNTWGLPFMDAELLDEVSLWGKKKIEAHIPCLVRNAHDHIP